MGSAVHTAGLQVELPGEAAMTTDRQGLLLAELVAFMTKDTPSVQHVLDLTGPHLREIAGLTAATVFELDSETGMMTATAQMGEAGRRDQMVAGKVFRTRPAASRWSTASRWRSGCGSAGRRSASCC